MGRIIFNWVLSAGSTWVVYAMLCRTSYSSDHINMAAANFFCFAMLYLELYDLRKLVERKESE